MVSKIPDLEFDSLQPCFYPDEDDFYSCSPDSAFPGEDIWKKFALLSTRPLAPSRAGLQGNPTGGAPVPWGEVSLGGFRTHDPLDWASKLLLLPAEADHWGSLDGGDLFKTVFGDSKNLSPIVLQDCMWNGFGARKKLERAVNEKLQGPVGAAVSPVTAGASITTASPGGIGSNSQAGLNNSLAPAEVFPFPSNKRETVAPAPATGGIIGIRVNISGNSRIAQRAAAAIQHSGHPTSATSSSEDDTLRKSVCISKDKEEGEDEVEEINVVTVEKRCSSSKKAVTTLTITMHPKNTTLTSVRTQQDELILKPCALIHQQHNYAAPSPDIKSKDTLQQKKLKDEVPHPIKAVIQPKPKNSSPQNADSKDSKRRCHQNSLERQRNKDLHARFLTLWGHVPELVQSKKATKILILKKATDYIHSLEAEEQKLLLEKEKLQARQQELLKEIEHIANC